MQIIQIGFTMWKFSAPKLSSQLRLNDPPTLRYFDFYDTSGPKFPLLSTKSIKKDLYIVDTTLRLSQHLITLLSPTKSPLSS